MNKAAPPAKTKQKKTAQEILHLADHLFAQAVHAHSFRCVLKQYAKNLEQYSEEMECSSSFYAIMYHSLATSLTLLLCRIYDENPHSLTINNLLNAMGDIEADYLHETMLETYNSLGQKLQHSLKPIEECLFEKEVEENKQIHAAIGLQYRNTTVDLTLSEYIQMYRKRYRQLKKYNAVNNLTVQRNKIIAHNDAGTNFDSRPILDQYPVSNEDVEMLLEFALDCTQFVRQILTGIYTIIDYIDGRDWRASLELIRIGMKYKDTYIKDEVDAFMRGIDNTNCP